MASSDVALASSRKNSRVSDGSLSYDEIRQQCAQLPAGALWEDRQFSGNAVRARPACWRQPRGRPAASSWSRGTHRPVRPPEPAGALQAPVDVPQV